MLNIIGIIMGILNVGMVATFIVLADRVSNWWVVGVVLFVGLLAQLLICRAIDLENSTIVESN